MKQVSQLALINKFSGDMAQMERCFMPKQHSYMMEELRFMPEEHSHMME